MREVLDEGGLVELIVVGKVDPKLLRAKVGEKSKAEGSSAFRVLYPQMQEGCPQP